MGDHLSLSNANHYINMEINLNSIQPRILGKSQKGQDSYIQHIFDIIGTTNKFYVEFGAADGVGDSNTFYLRETQGWTGLLLDPYYENQAINLQREFLTQENITEVFQKYSTPKSFDFLSVDVDGNDFWLLKSILSSYLPRVIMVETNVRFDPQTAIARDYNSNWQWDGWEWYGASPLAFKLLVNHFNYTPIFMHLDDMFIVHNDCLDDSCKHKPWLDIYPAANVELYNTHLGGRNEICHTYSPQDWSFIE